MTMFSSSEKNISTSQSSMREGAQIDSITVVTSEAALIAAESRSRDGTAVRNVGTEEEDPGAFVVVTVYELNIDPFEAAGDIGARGKEDSKAKSEENEVGK